MVSIEQGAPMSADQVTHLSDEQLAAYLDDAFTSVERAGVEAHLADCADCREEVVAIRRLVASRPRRRRWLLAPIAAAAALAFLLLPARVMRDPTGMGVRLREETTGPRGVDELMRTVLPADGRTVSATPREFAWRSAGVDATYRLALSDATGRLLFTITTTDTVVIVPDSLALAAGRYFWYVDAQRADGATTTSGARVFLIR